MFSPEHADYNPFEAQIGVFSPDEWLYVDTCPATPNVIGRFVNIVSAVVEEPPLFNREYTDLPLGRGSRVLLSRSKIQDSVNPPYCVSYSQEAEHRGKRGLLGRPVITTTTTDKLYLTREDVLLFGRTMARHKNGKHKSSISGERVASAYDVVNMLDQVVRALSRDQIDRLPTYEPPEEK